MVIACHTGKDKWEKELKKNADFLKERAWAGWSNHPLEKFVGQHCNAHHTLVLCGKHVSFPPPDKET